MNAISVKMKADYAETFFNAIKIGKYMRKKVQTLINCILTSEYQSKKQIFERYASMFEGHTPNYILEELVNHGIVEKEIREEGVVHKFYWAFISTDRLQQLHCENGVMEYVLGREHIRLDLATVKIVENHGYYDIEGTRLLPIHRAYYRLKEC